MKNLKLITIAIITIFVFACKKDKTNNKILNDGLTVYKNSPNSSDGLIATYIDANQTSTVYIYGSSNNEGRGTTAKSLVYDKNGNDTLINIILDADLRPSLLYVSTRTGVKINQLFMFEYLAGDSIQVSFYKYNWLDNTDSLMAQYVTKDGDGRVIYGARISDSNEYLRLFLSVAGAIVYIVGPVPIAAGLIVGVVLEGGALAGALTTLGTALALWSNEANAATLSSSLPAYPISPTNFQYQGNWSGHYTGTQDNGTWTASVNYFGVATGTVTSNVFLNTYQLNGTVSNQGVFDATVGSITNGAIYNGQMTTDGNASGTWINTSVGINGNWTGNKN